MVVESPALGSAQAATHASMEVTKRQMTNGVLYLVDSSSGLPSNQIQKFARDTLGRLWLAGPAGLSCYDGNFVHAYDRRNGLQCAGLRSVGTDAEGRVWVGTDLGLEVLDKAGKPLTSTVWSQWSYGLCDHMDASAGVVWIGTAQGVVRIETNHEPRIAFHADVGFVRHVAAVSATHAYAASDTHGLIEVYETSWKSFRNPALAGKHITRVAVRNQQLFVGSHEGAFVLDLDTKDISHHLKPPPTSDDVTALAVDKDTCWVAYGRVLVAYSLNALGETAEYYQLESRINDLLLDDLGNVWVATDTKGLVLLSCLRHALQHLDVGKEAAVFSIKPAIPETYAIGGDGFFGTLSVGEEQTHAYLETRTGLPESTVWDSFEDASGVWVASHAGLYHAAPEGQFERVTGEDVLDAPARVVVRQDQTLWVGTLRGLARIENGRIEEVTTSDGKSLGYIYALYLDDKDCLWIATLGRGLWRFDGRLEQVLGGPLSKTGNTYALAIAPQGIIILQDEKVILLDLEGSARLVTELHPISGWTALWLEANKVAIGSSEGLRFLNTATGEVEMTVRSLLPAPDWEFTNNRTLLQDNQGRLLCGLSGGLMRVDLNRLRSLLTPPVPHLSDVMWHGATPELRSTGYQLHPGKWSVSVRAFTAWFVDQGQVRYRFKLVGFDAEWGELQTQPEIHYTSLPYGDYEVMLQAYTPLTGFGPAETLFRITVARQWWATGWTAALASTEAFLDRYVRSHSRNQTMLARNRVLEKEVAERTAILRTANEQLEQARAELALLAHTDGLTQLANRPYFDQQLTRELERARRQRSELCLLLLDVDYFKAVNDQLGHQIGDDYLRSVAKILRLQVREFTDTVARYGGEEFVIILTGTTLEQAETMAKRICAAVEVLNLPNEGSPYGRLTISVGIAALSETLSGPDLIKSADAALYEAKRRGRNQIVVSDGPVNRTLY